MKSCQGVCCEGLRRSPHVFEMWAPGLGGDVGKNTVQEMVALIKIDIYLFTYKGTLSTNP